MGVEAHLYKMLMYERGGHFLAHRDTEKEPGMFATYLLHLPVTSGYTGGSIVIKQGGLKPGHLEIVFYADCEHELRTVESVWRVVVAFNLISPQHDN